MQKGTSAWSGRTRKYFTPATHGRLGMLKNIAIAVLALATVFLSSALVRVENQRYAMLIGMCPGTSHAIEKIPGRRAT